MAVFHVVSDESSGTMHRDMFYRAGFIAPEKAWGDSFTPAWQERALDGPPAIPYFHMTEMRSAKFRNRYSLSRYESEQRIDEAFRIIDSLGSLVPIACTANGGDIRDIFNETPIISPKPQPKSQRFRMEPDYLCFTAFTYIALDYVSKHHPDCEKVDFVIEHNKPITDRLRDLHKTIPESLMNIDRGDLIPLLGAIIPGEKTERLPFHVADLLCWYMQRYEKTSLSPSDLRRYSTILRRRSIHTSVLCPRSSVGRASVS